jgi:hypothetical protein
MHASSILTTLFAAVALAAPATTTNDVTARAADTAQLAASAQSMLDAKAAAGCNILSTYQLLIPIPRFLRPIGPQNAQLITSFVRVHRCACSGFYYLCCRPCRGGSQSHCGCGLLCFSLGHHCEPGTYLPHTIH